METTKPKPFCFVLMPFDKSFDDIYKFGIKDACNDAGAYCERVDEQIFEERILDRIFNQIVKADIVIADMTGKNPNVFYEVGYAHALGKTTMLLTKQSEDIPFDLKHFPHIIYSNSITSLKAEITKKVKFFLENPATKIEDKLAIEIYSGEFNMSAENVFLIGSIFQGQEKILGLDLVFQNNSTITFTEGDFKVGIIFSENFSYISRGESKGITRIKLPNGKSLCMLPYFDTLFPSAFTKFSLQAVFSEPAPVEDAIIRIFSNVGNRDYSFKIKF